MHMLMGLFDQVVNMKYPLREFGTFFKERDHVDTETTGFTKHMYEVYNHNQKLPKNGRLYENLLLFDKDMIIE